MAYIQHKNPFPVTSCGRRRAGGIARGFAMDKPSSLKKLRKTTKGKGRHFLPAKQGAGMTAAGRAAYNKETGVKLWEFKLPTPAFATPAIYSVDGKQYLAIACGGEKLQTKKGNKIIAFTLEKKKSKN